MNIIWLAMTLIGVAVAAWRGEIHKVTDAAMKGAEGAVEVAIGLIGVMALWLGIMRIGEDAGIIRLVGRVVKPVMVWLFPGIPKDHPAMGSIIMNISANMLGLGSAATPFGMKAMQAMQDLNPDKETASDAMCTFLALNTSAITLIPATILSVRVAAGSANPTEIVGTTMFATAVGMAVAVTADRLLRRRYYRKKRGGF